MLGILAVFGYLAGTALQRLTFDQILLLGAVLKYYISINDNQSRV